jgi:hypothetical protein
MVTQVRNLPASSFCNSIATPHAKPVYLLTTPPTMATLTFSAAVMDDIRAAMRQQRLHKQARALAPPPAATNHHEDWDHQDVAMDEPELYTCDHEEHEDIPTAQRVFDSWIQDLDEQTLPEMDNDELRILHALLFGAGDDAFAVADELLKQTLAA